MAEETLRRNLDAAFDAGPDFPNPLLLSRTMAAVKADAGIATRDGSRGSRDGYSPVWRRPGMRLTAVAMALIIAAVATAAFLAFRSFYGPAPVPAKPYSSSVARSCSHGDLHMITSSVGWNGTSRTTDGGITWKDVSPRALPDETPGGRVLCALDADHAWVTQVGGSSDTRTGRLYVFRTRNGGQSWQAAGQFPVSGAPPDIHLEFIDYQHGWLQTSSGAYSNQPQTPPVYSTSDAGIHWSKVAPRPEGVWPAGTSLKEYYLCNPNGMMFVSLTRGWLVRDCTTRFSTNSVTVGIVTNDGGHSWQTLSLDYAAFPPHTAVPTDGTTAFWNCGASPPVFSGSEGALPVSCVSYKGVHGSDGSWTVGERTGSDWSGVFRTTDSGITWTAAPLPLYVKASHIDFVDANNGFALVTAYPNNALYRTTNGGRDWLLVDTGLFFPGGSIFIYQFVDTTTGFAYLTEWPDSLVKTTDGGVTWRPDRP